MLAFRLALCIIVSGIETGIFRKWFNRKDTPLKKVSIHLQQKIYFLERGEQ